MKKIVLILLMLSLSLNAFEELKSMSQLKEHDLIFLAFEKNGCPWCRKYKNELEPLITKKYKSDIKFFKAKKGTEVFSEFTKEFGLKIIIYPMTYVLKLNEKKESQIVHEIYGYQTEEYVEELFKNKLKIKP